MNGLLDQLFDAIDEISIAQRIHNLRESLVAFAIILFVAAACQQIARVVSRWLMRLLVRWLDSHQEDRWTTALKDHLVAGKTAHVVAATVVYYAVPSGLASTPTAANVIHSLTGGYLVVVATLFVNSLLGAIGDVLAERRQRSQLSIRVATQASQWLAVAIGVVVLIAVLFGVSLPVLLSSLAGMTAVLMLMFRDSILGFVAGIQLSANDMLRIGDWVEVPQFGADGTIYDVRLTTVKIQNFDKTITTVPTYAMVSQSFKNWRGMNESEVRRIKRSVPIDMESVVFLNEEQLTELERTELLREHLVDVRAEIEQFNEQFPTEARMPPNTRNLTNLGLFRIYLEKFLAAHPSLDENLPILVRHLPPTKFGLPVEVYAFSKIQDWKEYERLQSDIFDHVLTTLPIFGLHVFQIKSDCPPDFS